MGDAKGHYLPSSFFLAFSLFYLALSFRRSLAAPLRSYLPESNQSLLRIFGGLIAFFATLGLVMEGLNCVLVCGSSYGSFFAKLTHQSLHEVLYLSFGLTGLAAHLEGRGLLPPSSHRVLLLLALFVESQLWAAHASMQSGSEAHQHELLSTCCLATAAVTSLTLALPGDALAHVAVWALLALQGLWLFSIGATIGDAGTSMPAHAVAPLFYAEALVRASEAEPKRPELARAGPY
jgi:hypothetical protein